MSPQPLTPSGTPPVGGPIRVMIVDDSVFVRGIISSWLDGDKSFEVVATHSNGKRAADDVVRTAPDAIILDLEMPEMDGLTALPLILERKPNAVVLVASALTRRGAEISMKALGLGAADYLAKPNADRGSIAAEEFRSELLGKLRGLVDRARRRGASVASVAAAPPPRAMTAPAPAPAPAAAPASPAPAPRAPASPAALASPPAPALARPALSTATPVVGVGAPPKTVRKRPYSMSPVEIIAVGSSTGGPQALTRIFSDFGAAIANVPVVIAQHMPPTFTAILAEHVGRAAARTAAEGVDGEVLKPGRIYIAPGGKHMLVAKSGADTVIRLSDGPAVNFCKPAVDPLFDSVAAIYGSHVLAIVLTGMGSDGAKGAGVIADAGGSVIVQDEESSVVWGMPGATYAAGNASELISVNNIGAKVTRLLMGGRA
ncbi:protein-glutamate methylesterase/protein-glutamine glutaminase [Roseixanthobacter glucoisosaccharinicivorans]|uniref:protein-glutamate methylesterase/protein-glutamine glutaminase n=1 Tax=Roseixanthobacter glucoisosaccharinicivorans TaxID=3119923 RepID=UPI003729D162